MSFVRPKHTSIDWACPRVEEVSRLSSSPPTPLVRPPPPPRSLNLTFATNATLPEPPLGPASVCLTNHPSHPPLAWRNPRVSVTRTCIRAFTCHVRVWRGVTMATHPHHGGETPLAGAGSRPIVAHPCLCLCIGVHVSTYVSASPRNRDGRENVCFLRSSVHPCLFPAFF